MKKAMDGETPSYGASWRWPLLVSVVFLNVCLPSLVLSYGVLLVHALEVGAPQWLCFATPTVFVLTYGFTQCWSRDAADSWGGPTGYRILAALGLASVLASLLVSAVTSHAWHPLVYGLFGGLGSSLISAQVDAVIFETYDSHLTLIRGLCFVGQAVGLATFPHIISALVYEYGYSMSYIVFGGIMLQTLVPIMLLRVSDIVRRPISFSRYSDKTYVLFNDGDTSYYDNELNDLSKKGWKSPSDDKVVGDEFPEDVFDNEAYVTVTPPPSPEEKRRNLFGVEILPEIPEESEESDIGEENERNQKRLSLAIKRFSAMSDNFSEYIIKQKIDSQSKQSTITSKEYQEIEVTYDNISPETDVQREDSFHSYGYRCNSIFAGMKRRILMPSYKVYRVRRRILYVIFIIQDTIIKPLYRSLFCWKFYPALMLSFTKVTLTAIQIVLIPVIASQNYLHTNDTNFLMTLYGFSWLCFLLVSPWLAQTPKRNFKYVVVVGLIISTAACFLLSKADSHDMFSVGSVIAGFGYGAITSCWETAIRDFLGARLWPKLHSTLETTTSSCQAIFSCIMYFIVILNEGFNFQFCFFILGVILSVTTFVWMIVSVVGLYITNMRSFHIRRIWT